MDHSNSDQETRDKLLKRELEPDKVKLIEKFGLSSTKNQQWVSKKENAHDHFIFNHNYLKKNDIIKILFRINRLCFAKVSYFSKNAENFEPHVYDFQKGFIKTDWWNTEFLRHTESGHNIDLRYLQTITDIEKFHELCAYLENHETKDK